MWVERNIWKLGFYIDFAIFLCLPVVVVVVVVVGTRLGYCC
jgi:hypothetical protein